MTEVACVKNKIESTYILFTKDIHEQNAELY